MIGEIGKCKKKTEKNQMTETNAKLRKNWKKYEQK